MDVLNGDPDYLCAIALTLHEINPKARRNTAEHHLEKDLRKQAAVFDSLARLVVYKAKQQIVAIGAALDPLDRIELYVAGNSELPPKISQHLEVICTRLHSVRTAIAASPNPTAVLNAISKDPYVRKETTEPALLSLLDLQMVLFKYSIERIRARFAKRGWKDRFNHIVVCIDGPPADISAQLSPNEKDDLVLLQSSTTVQTLFPLLRLAVVQFTECMEGKMDFNKLRRACSSIINLVSQLDKEMLILDSFILSTRFCLYIPRQHV